jgi:hypothetical protein
MTINHKNGNKEDDRVENLELDTYSENIDHAYQILNRPKEKNYANYYITNPETGEEFKFSNAVKAGKYFNVSPMTIKQYSVGHFKGLLLDTYEVKRKFRKSMDVNSEEVA